jgi:hypothetical protein
MRKNKFDIGDLVEITTVESAFKAHPDMLSGKLAIVTQPPSMHSSMFVYFVLVDGIVISVMEDHLRDPERQEKIKQYEEYTD